LHGKKLSSNKNPHFEIVLANPKNLHKIWIMVLWAFIQIRFRGSQIRTSNDFVISD